METPTLAIDFGTSRTKVAFFDERTGKPQLVELGTEIRTVLPSVFYMPKEIQGKRLVGDDAQNMAEKDPAGIILSLKKEIHKLGKKRCGDRPSIGRVELASELFSYIYQQCQREVFYNEDSIRCRLTVPSDFKAPQRDAIKNAAQLGGFTEVTTIDEPVAAAQSWLRNHSDKKFGSSVVVCDIGGGTTDFAFLRYAEGHFEADEQILSAGFSEGGNDLDVLIWEKICENDPATGEMDDLVAGFLIKIRRERELILKTHQDEILISVKGQQCVLTRAIIQDATAEFIDRVKIETKRFLENIHKQVKTDTPPIVLVGGASRLPGLCDALTSLDAGAVYRWNDSDYATVLGAVDIPAKASPSNKRAIWNEYGKAVEMAWADRVLQRAEFDYLVKLQEKLGVPDAEAAMIEKALMGADKGSLISGTQTDGADSIGPSADAANWAKNIHDLIGDGKSEEALIISTKAMIEHPNDDWFDLWVECCGTSPNADEVLSNARNIYNRRNNDYWSASCLALAFEELGRHDEANQTFKPFLKTSYNNPYPVAYVTLQLSNDDVQRKELLEKLQALRPCNTVLLAFRALQLLSDRNSGEALVLFANALRINPYCCCTLTFKAYAFLQFGVGDEALFQADLRVMERIVPEHFSTLALKGMYLAAKGDFPGAKAALNLALADSRLEQSQEIASQLFYFRSLCHQNLQDIEATRRDVEASLRRNPKNIAAWKMKAAISYHQQRYLDAFLEFSLGLAIDANDVECLCGKAECFLTTDQFADSARNFGMAWNLSDTNDTARKGTVYASIAELLTSTLSAKPSGLFLWPNIPETKLNPAVQSYIRPFNVPPSTYVLLLFDATMLGGSEDGFCLTEDAIYWHNAWEEMRYFQKYSSITEIRVVDSKVIVNGREILGLGNMVSLVQKLLFLLNGLYERHLHGGTQAAKASDSQVQHLQGTCLNSTVRMQGALSLQFATVNKPANNGLMNICGFIELFGLGGSGKIEGTLTRTQIQFASVDHSNGFRVEWSGTVTGKVVEGTYNVVCLEKGKDSVQSGTWQAEWFEK